MYRKNTAGQFVCFQMLLTATGAIATGLSPAVRRCVDGTFAAGGGTITEDTGTGCYKYAMAQADTNGNDISMTFTATGAMPVCINFVTTAADPTSAANFGLTNLDTTITSRMATYTQPAGFLATTFPTGTVANTTNITAASGVTVSTNSDKTGYSLTQAFPTNFSSFAITVGGAVTAGTVSDKTGYSLTQAFPSNFSATAISAGGAVTVGTNNDKTGYTASTVSDKTGYSLTQTFPTNFSALSITAGGTVNADAKAINANTTAAANVAHSMQAITRGTCSGGTTATAIVSTLTSPSSLGAAGQLIGRTILFDADTTTANLQGQASNITASTTGATPTITFTAMTTAPVNGDTFSIL